MHVKASDTVKFSDDPRRFASERAMTAMMEFVGYKLPDGELLCQYCAVVECGTALLSRADAIWADCPYRCDCNCCGQVFAYGTEDPD